jgi:excisionase family DNA binding protein
MIRRKPCQGRDRSGKEKKVFLTIRRKKNPMAGQPKKRRQAQAPATATIVEAAKRLGIGRNQAYEAAHRGEIPTIRIGRRWLVPIAALDALLQGGATRKVSRAA